MNNNCNTCKELVLEPEAFCKRYNKPFANGWEMKSFNEYKRCGSVRLNLGCGTDIKKGYINVDFKKSLGVDLICDFNNTVLPFVDNSVDEIILSHVLEHLVEPLKLVLECHRVLKKDGVLLVKLPTNCMEVDHLRYTHGYSYFDGLTLSSSDSGVTGLQGGMFFDKVYVKGNRRSWSRVVSRFLEWFRSLLVDEYEYRLRKK
jgi:SAM-dependent methyltransferase